MPDGGEDGGSREAGPQGPLSFASWALSFRHLRLIRKNPNSVWQKHAIGYILSINALEGSLHVRHKWTVRLVACSCTSQRPWSRGSLYLFWAVSGAAKKGTQDLGHAGYTLLPVHIPGSWGVFSSVRPHFVFFVGVSVKVFGPLFSYCWVLEIHFLFRWRVCVTCLLYDFSPKIWFVVSFS